MIPWPLLGGFGSGLAGGLLSGLFGIGGGIVLVPLLGLLLHLTQHQAQGVTLAAMLLPNGLPAVLHYRRHGVRLRWNLVGCLAAGFLGGVWVGAVVANLIPPTPMRWGFVVFLLALALRFAIQQARPGFEEPASPDLALSRMLLPGLLIGALGGAASGLLGIGGGVVVIPLLIAWLGLPQREATLTSLALMLPPIGLPGVLRYARAQGGLPWLVLAGLAVGFACGAFLGARAATRTRGPALRRAFIALLVLMAALLAAR